MKQLAIVFLLLVYSLSLRAQLHERALVDSLLHEIPNSREDTNQAVLLDTISVVFRTINPDSGIVYGLWGLRVSEKLSWKKGVAKAYNALGVNYFAKTDNPTALDHYLRALAIFEELDDKARIASTLGNIGAVYKTQKKIAKALHYDSLALNIYEKINDKQGITRILGNIGVLYDDQQDFPKAREYYFMALNIARQIGNKSDEAKNLGNIANVYYSQNNFSEAVKSGLEALSIYEKLGDKSGMAINASNVGAYYLATAANRSDNYDYNGPLDPGKKALVAKAIDYLNKGLNISKDIGYLDGLINCYQTLSDACLFSGDFRSSRAYYVQFIAIKDSVYSSANDIKITNLETKRELDLRQKEITIRQLKEANKRNQSFVYIAGIVLLMVIFGIVIKYFINEIKSNRRLAKERKKHIERIRAQKTVLKDIAHIQSHEVRGPVSTILGLVELFNYEDPADPNNKELIEGIATVTRRLDKIVTDVVSKENSLGEEKHDEDTEEYV